MSILPIRIPIRSWKPLDFAFDAPLPYKKPEFPNSKCWPDGKKGHTRESLQKEWKERAANFKPSALTNAMIQKNIELIRENLLNREEKKGEWIKEIEVKTQLRSTRAQIIDEEFLADRLVPMSDGSYGLCYSCGKFSRIDSLTAEHVQPKNSTNYAIIERQKWFLDEFSKITNEEREEILKKTKAREYIIIVSTNKRNTKKDNVIGDPIENGKLPEDTEFRINEFFLRSYLNDVSNLICMCSSCNTKTFYNSMEDKLRHYPLLTHEKAEQAFNFSLEARDIMYTSKNRRGLGHAIIAWVNSDSENNLFDLLRKQFIYGRTNSIPLTPVQEDVKNQLIESSPEKFKDEVEENIADVILRMKKMGIPEKAVQKFLLEQWNGPKIKRELFED